MSWLVIRPKHHMVVLYIKRLSIFTLEKFVEEIKEKRCAVISIKYYLGEKDAL